METRAADETSTLSYFQIPCPHTHMLSRATSQLLSVSSIISSLLKGKRAASLERMDEGRVFFSQKRSYQEKQQWFPEGWAAATDTRQLGAEGDVASPGRRVLSDTSPVPGHQAQRAVSSAGQRCLICSRNEHTSMSSQQRALAQGHVMLAVSSCVSQALKKKKKAFVLQ